ncbi:MAG TPA: alkene reductase [Paraburkholderia sp.]|uniref:alkene reductase n=1 Tax=Paraburkholderia sp. TaxID=1926495 RepID=UPI002BBF776A|nr:alkene reductase [Paraburkholderia sp.]HTR07946.1 alkene reductase [Paraburkholderia sp.]
MQSDPLFTPLKLGAVALKHRVIMAPMTRMRSAQPGNVPHALNAEYYRQRASEGGLLITEATDITPQAQGYRGTPGLYSAEQIAGWRAVTDAVHAKGGFIFSQIWHVGRISHSSLQPGGALPVAPSAVRPAGEHTDASGQNVPYETPRALEEAELAELVSDFVTAARNAREAGFDGVEVHGANGYLLDQFLRNGSNKRTDRYGGSIENRARLLLEVVDAVIAALGAERVGVRLSPWNGFNDMSDSDGEALWNYIAAELDKRELAYLHVVEPRSDFTTDLPPDANARDATSHFKSFFKGPLISTGGYVAETARAAVAAGRADAIAFGRPFISNPDLPERLRIGAAVTRYDRATFYGGDHRGYTDYASLAGETNQDVLAALPRQSATDKIFAWVP